MKLTMTQGIFHITTHHGTIHITHTFSRTKTLGGGQGILPNIRNHVYKAKRASQLSKLDQENLQLKIEQWKKLTVSLPLLSYQSTLHSDKRPREGESCCTLTILYVHQELWQQELLEGYGNTISHLDTTRSSVLSCTKDKCWLFSGGRIF